MSADKDFLLVLYNHRDACVNYLLGKTKCDRDQAENIFIEAVLVLRKKNLNNELEEVKDLKSYLTGTCQTIWKRNYFKEKKKDESSVDVERYFYDYLKERNMDSENIHLVKEKLLDIAQSSLDTLGEKCRKIIRFFYYEKKSMTEIAKIMDFNTQAVATATKYRCFKELRDKAMKMRIQFEKE